MSAYYNENDPKAAAWLRELIKADLIAPGGVDERSIEDVAPSDLRGYDQHHFFAGIGGWSYALRLAGWPDDKPVWTGSCPCQPFSAAGKRKGTADDRHLWPAWHWLIKQYRPSCVFGEQVASKDGIAWLDIVSTDLEGEGYTFAPIVFPACGVGAPHKRERLWFVAESEGFGLAGRRTSEEVRSPRELARSCDVGGLGDTSGERARRNAGAIPQAQREAPMRAVSDGAIATSATRNMADSTGDGAEPNWRGAEWHRCKDGKHRAIEPSVFPLVNGATARMGRLRGYGNAIVPQVAKELICAYEEARRILGAGK